MFAEKLRQYGVTGDPNSLPNLTTKAGTRVRLDPKLSEFSLNIHYIEMKTIDDVKRVLGHPDRYWATDQPRFGTLAPTRAPADRLDEMTPALRAALREYVYGNSKSVAGWTTTLNNWIVGHPLNVGLFVFNDVTVAPGSVLEIGAEGLICNTLRVQSGGSVVVSGDGPVRIEMSTYEEYPPPTGGGGGGGGGGGPRPPHPRPVFQ